ncbi:MAG: toll/interleukin-1 receptor domain-containing protein [Planctomycetia bacterium]|nr:toll/interleukin-1 receptor domain-containing protein [Planctomycetia bacterium]
MNVFISWSRPRSEAVARAIYWFLPKVVHFVERFMSEEDIEKGSRGLDRINSELDQCNVGIICLTPENQDRPWINYEAGAIAKSVAKGKAITLNYGLSKADVKGPLSQFQHTELAVDEKEMKSEVIALVTSLNNSGGEKRIREAELLENLEKWWPDFKKKIDEVKQIHTDETVPKVRSLDDKVDEILEVVRNTRRSQPGDLSWHSQFENLSKEELSKRLQRSFAMYLDYGCTSDGEREKAKAMLELAKANPYLLRGIIGELESSGKI